MRPLSVSTYADAMFKNWQKDPNSVDSSWRNHFESSSFATSQPTASAVVDEKEITDNLKVERLIRGFLVRGHNVCDLDPLGILNADLDASIPEEV